MLWETNLDYSGTNLKCYQQAVPTQLLEQNKKIYIQIFTNYHYQEKCSYQQLYK